MDNRQQAVCNRLESRLRQLLLADQSWKDSAKEIAESLDLDNPDLSNQQHFVDSAATKLSLLAREAVKRGMSPADLDKVSSPTDLVNNLLP